MALPFEAVTAPLPPRLPQTPAELRSLTTRPGLDPALRCLVLGKAAVWPLDLDCFRAAVEVAQEQGAARAEWEEMLLQAVLFCGFPRVITAFAAFDKAWPGAVPRDNETRDAGQRRRDGDVLFARIYADKTAAVREMLRGHHPALQAFVQDSAYGRVLSRPGLPACRRELLAVGILALTGQTPQLIAHGRGALRCGAEVRELEEVLRSVLGEGQGVDRAMRKIGGA